MAATTEPDSFKAALADPATRDDRCADVIEEIVAERALDLPREVELGERVEAEICLTAYNEIMRTTLNLDDDLVARAKALAARRGRSLTSLMEDALRAVLEREKGVMSTPTVALPVGSGRLRPGTSLDDNTALRDLMDDVG